MKLNDQVAVVTGGGSGIGRATARRFAAEGARVAVLDRDEATAQATANEFGGFGLGLDVSVSADVDRVFAEVVDQLGPINVLANIAGINPAPNDATELLFEANLQRMADMRAGRPPSVHVDHLIRMPDEGWHTMMRVHVDGTMFCTRAALRSMAEANIGGAIVNCASIAALAGMGQTHYATAKGAILGFTRGLAREVASRGIRVNVVCPGVIDTPMSALVPDPLTAAISASIPLGRNGTPEELAAAFLFLACDESSYLTGQYLSPNGGLIIG